jgi:hypothetical protein
MENRCLKEKIILFETNSPQEKHKINQIMAISRFICAKCQKHFSSASNLKQHSNVHINSLSRQKFTCFIKNCKKSYLYICTLKKHIQTFHQKEYDVILNDFYGNERNFQTIYNYLLEHSGIYDFIEIKSSNNFYSNSIEMNQNNNYTKLDKFNKENQMKTRFPVEDNYEIKRKNFNSLKHNFEAIQKHQNFLSSNIESSNIYSIFKENNCYLMNNNNNNTGLSYNFHDNSSFLSNNPLFNSYFANTLYINVLLKLYSSFVNLSPDATL